DPGRPVILGSSDSPIPINVVNGLSVAITVRLNFRDTPGFRPPQLRDVLVPARGSAPQNIRAEVNRSGRFSVDVWLSTPDGAQLGETARVQISSTSYGTVTLVITAVAFGALVILAGLRILRRLR